MKAISEKKNSKSTFLARRVLDGEPMADLRESEPGFCLMHHKQIEYFASAVERDKLRARKRGFAELTVTAGGHGASLVRDWLVANVGKPRRFKQKQLFIQAIPNSGKTSLMKMLSEYINVYWVPMFEDFEDEYENDIYDLVVLDEFKGQRKLTWMNMFSQGGPMHIRKKGSQYLKTDNPPVVVLSNHHLEECYSNCSAIALEAFRARFDFISLEPDYFGGQFKAKFVKMTCIAKE